MAGTPARGQILQIAATFGLRPGTILGVFVRNTEICLPLELLRSVMLATDCLTGTRDARGPSTSYQIYQ